MDSSSRFLVFLGLSFTGITAAVAYLLLRKDEETEHVEGLRTSRRTVIKVNVPCEVMGTVIGRGGCNIQSIQQKTGARINCGDEGRNDKFRVVTIQGSPEAAQLAESMIHEIIMNQPLIITHEMWVPSRACGRIIGKGGETIRLITRTSCAKIIVDSTGDDNRTAERRVLLKGTAEQIALAQSLIDEKVAEDADLRLKVEMSIANRSPRREPKDNLNCLVAPSDEDNVKSLRKTERFDSASSEGFFDVFVSAFENPSQFWVQLVNSRGVELDQLVDEMTDYYSKPANQELHTLHEIAVGQIVAAPFDHDNKWYRAEILKIEEDEYDPAESRVTLYYGDYGDSCVIRRRDLFDLSTDFLTLYFQAIECVLAHVRPSGDEWSDEATSLFEELAEVAFWRKKSAHVVTYRDGAQKRGQRAGSPVPVIELHDMEKGVSIGEELVKQGLAVWESSSPTQDSLESNGVRTPSSKSIVNPSTDHVNVTDPLKMSPFAFGGTIPKKSIEKNTSEASSSFISQERGPKGDAKFLPKTLESNKKKQLPKKVQTIVVPERFSSDEDEFDGFTLE